MKLARVFFDTSSVIAMENRRDPHHAAAKILGKKLEKQGSLFLLHTGIVLEIGDGFARTVRREQGNQILNVIQSRLEYHVRQIDSEIITDAIALYRSRPDKEWGLTDCVSFALMEREGIKEALTADPHFRQAGFVPLLLEGETT